MTRGTPVAGVDFDTQRLSGVPLRLQTSTKHQVAVLREPERLKSVVLSTEAAKFLGYEITVQKSSTKITRGRRAVNGSVRLRVPRAVTKEKCARYCKRGEPAPRTPLVNKSDLDIVATYGSEYRGIVQFYLLASDVCRLNRLNGVMRASLLKTLACKHHTTGRKMGPDIRPRSRPRTA
jgi:hypothetical protein